MEDITDFLAFEVKKEMADRYFGFRKQIEDDTALYKDRIARSAFDLENKIGFTLIRIYILLREDSLISSFIQLIGLETRLFYDRYILDSPTIRKRVFCGQYYHGLTWKRGYKNMFFDNYSQLVKFVDEYRSTLAELTEEQETIREEINLFYRNNDIDSIMRFIRRLDNPDVGVLNTMQPAANGAQQQEGLGGQMRMHPPLPACDMLPTLPPLPPLQDIRKQLKQLIEAAIPSKKLFDLRELTKE